MSGLNNLLSSAGLASSLLVIKAKRGFKPQASNPAGTDLSPFAAMVVMEEVHSDDMEITDHPVALGVTISDHAFKRPAELTITCAWSDSPNSADLGPLLSGLTGSQASLASTLLGNSSLASTALGGVASGAAKVLNAALAINATATAAANLFGSGESVSQSAYQKLLNYQNSATVLTVFTGKRLYSDMLIKSISVTTDSKTENCLIAKITLRNVIFVSTVATQVPDQSVQANPQSTASPVNAGSTSLVPAPNYNTALA